MPDIIVTVLFNLVCKNYKVTTSALYACCLPVRLSAAQYTETGTIKTERHKKHLKLQKKNPQFFVKSVSVSMTILQLSTNRTNSNIRYILCNI